MEMDIDLQESPVRVLVGPEESCFFVNPTILQKSSQFFKAAMKKQWREGQQREIKLPEDAIDAFQAYVQWLYTGVLNERCQPTLVDLYVLGEKYIDPTFQDDTINALVAFTQIKDENGRTIYPVEEAIAACYQQTPPNSPMCRLIVDFYLVHARLDWITDEVRWPEPFELQFLVALTGALLDVKNGTVKINKVRTQISSGAPCAYHKHDQDHPCGPEVRRKFFKELNS